MKPQIPCTNPAFQYTPAVRTDVTATWRRYGWHPRGEPTSTPSIAPQGLLTPTGGANIPVGPATRRSKAPTRPVTR